MRPDAPAPQAILEASLYVDDLAAAAEFYGEILGLEEIQRVEERHIFYRCGGSVLLLFRAEETRKPPSNPRLPVPPHGAHGPGHVCFAQPRNEMNLMKQRLLDAGVAIEAEFDWPGGARSLYFRDPAGNSLEIAEPHLWRG